MKTLFTLSILISCSCFGQDAKWWGITKKDIAPMSLVFVAGHAKGWADQVEFHHHEMSIQFPGLFKNGKTFWDGRYDDDGIWDAKHMMEGIRAKCFILAIVFKVGDLKKYPKKDRWKKVGFDLITYSAIERFGFTTSYNGIHKNPIFK